MRFSKRLYFSGGGLHLIATFSCIYSSFCMFTLYITTSNGIYQFAAYFVYVYPFASLSCIFHLITSTSLFLYIFIFFHPFTAHFILLHLPLAYFSYTVFLGLFGLFSMNFFFFQLFFQFIFSYIFL